MSSHVDYSHLSLPGLLPNPFDTDDFQQQFSEQQMSSTLGQTINIQNRASDLDLSQIDDSDLSWLFPGSQMWHTG